MIRTSLLFFVLGYSILSSAQSDTTAPYLKNKSLPAFSLLNIDSTVFTHQNIDQNKNTIIMLFNPECDHCQKQLDLLLSIPKVVRSTQLVLSSIETVAKNKIFYDKNRLKNYPFIYVGKDYKYIFGNYFQPHTIPVLAFYNKKRVFVSISHGNANKKTILAALKD